MKQVLYVSTALAAMSAAAFAGTTDNDRVLTFGAMVEDRGFVIEHTAFHVHGACGCATCGSVLVFNIDADAQSNDLLRDLAYIIGEDFQLAPHDIVNAFQTYPGGIFKGDPGWQTAFTDFDDTEGRTMWQALQAGGYVKLSFNLGDHGGERSTAGSIKYRIVAGDYGQWIEDMRAKGLWTDTVVAALRDQDTFIGQPGEPAQVWQISAALTQHPAQHMQAGTALMVMVDGTHAETGGPAPIFPGVAGNA